MNHLFQQSRSNLVEAHVYDQMRSEKCWVALSSRPSRLKLIVILRYDLLHSNTLNTPKYICRIYVCVCVCSREGVGVVAPVLD